MLGELGEQDSPEARPSQGLRRLGYDPVGLRGLDAGHAAEAEGDRGCSVLQKSSQLRGRFPVGVVVEKPVAGGGPPVSVARVRGQDVPAPAEQERPARPVYLHQGAPERGHGGKAYLLARVGHQGLHDPPVELLDDRVAQAVVQAAEGRDAGRTAEDGARVGVAADEERLHHASHGRQPQVLRRHETGEPQRGVEDGVRVGAGGEAVPEAPLDVGAQERPEAPRVLEGVAAGLDERRHELPRRGACDGTER